MGTAIPGGRWNRFLDTETEPMSLIRSMIRILSQNYNFHLESRPSLVLTHITIPQKNGVDFQSLTLYMS